MTLLRDDAGFDDAQRFELALGLGLFLAMSKVLIAMGVEPEPGTMPTTEVATPDTARPHTSLRDGMDELALALDDALADHAGVVAAARARVRHLVAGGPPTHDAPVGPPAVLDVAELFVIDAHAITDEQVGAVCDLFGPSPAAAFLVALAHADVSARLERSGANRLAVAP